MTPTIALLLDGSAGDAAVLSWLERLPFPAPGRLLLVRAGTAEPGGEVTRFSARGWQVVERSVEASWDDVASLLSELAPDLVLTGSGAGDAAPLGRPPRRVVREVESGFLVCRPALEPHAAGPPKLLLAYDDSAPARAAVRRVRALAWPEGTQITLLSVLTVGTTMFRRDILERLGDAWQEHKREVLAELDAVARSLEGGAATIATKVLDGGTDPSDEILQAAVLLDADLIVAGYNGHSGLVEALLGSVAAHLIEHAACSVWIVRR